MIDKEFEFESPELARFEAEISEKSKRLIQQTIEQHSPIQVGEIVTSYYGAQKLQVTNIKLLGVTSIWDPLFSKLSFHYEGIPVKKDGTPMQNRKPIEFGSFIRNGEVCHMPSYYRKQIITATMIRQWIIE